MRALSIVKNTEKRLVNERIHVISGKLTVLHNEYDTVLDSVKKALQINLVDLVLAHTAKFRVMNS